MAITVEGSARSSSPGGSSVVSGGPRWPGQGWRRGSGAQLLPMLPVLLAEGHPYSRYWRLVLWQRWFQRWRTSAAFSPGGLEGRPRVDHLTTQIPGVGEAQAVGNRNPEPVRVRSRGAGRYRTDLARCHLSQVTRQGGRTTSRFWHTGCFAAAQSIGVWHGDRPRCGAFPLSKGTRRPGSSRPRALFDDLSSWRHDAPATSARWPKRRGLVEVGHHAQTLRSGSSKVHKATAWCQGREDEPQTSGRSRSGAAAGRFVFAGIWRSRQPQPASCSRRVTPQRWAKAARRDRSDDRLQKQSRSQ